MMISSYLLVLHRAKTSGGAITTTGYWLAVRSSKNEVVLELLLCVSSLGWLCCWPCWLSPLPKSSWPLSLLQLFNSERSLGSAWVLLPVPQPGNSLSRQKLDNHVAHLIFLPHLSGITLPIDWCLVLWKSLFPTACLVFIVSVWGQI